MRTLAALAAGLALLCCGCSTLDPWSETSTSRLSAYTRSRVADLLDSVPMSFAWGWGASASFKATPLVDLGLGLSPVVDDRVGYDDRRFHGYWREYQTCFPWTPFLEDLGSVPPRPWGANEGRTFGDGLPIVYRWQIIRDAPSGEGEYPGSWEPAFREWGRHPPLGRESGGAFLIPEYRRALNWRDLRLEQGDDEPLFSLGSPVRATLWEVSRDGRDEPRAWDLFEADLFVVCLGVRVGFRPVEAADFLTGIVGLDFLGDDIPVTSSNEPLPLPRATLPDAPPVQPEVIEPPLPGQPEVEPQPEPAPAPEPAPTPAPEPAPAPAPQPEPAPAPKGASSLDASR